MQQVRIILNEGGRHISLILNTYVTSEQLYKWRVENEDLVNQARILAKVYKKDIDTINRSDVYCKEDKDLWINTLNTNLINKLQEINLLTTNVN